jgi:hypothetical protein
LKLPRLFDDARPFWNARFAEQGLVDGDVPNAFLRELAEDLPLGGQLILEACAPRQLALGTGEPPVLELQVLILEETHRVITEGPFG